MPDFLLVPSICSNYSFRECIRFRTNFTKLSGEKFRTCPSGWNIRECNLWKSNARLYVYTRSSHLHRQTVGYSVLWSESLHWSIQKRIWKMLLEFGVKDRVELFYSTYIIFESLCRTLWYFWHFWRYHCQCNPLVHLCKRLHNVGQIDISKHFIINFFTSSPLEWSYLLWNKKAYN